MIAEILSIGDELLFGQTLDTNAATICRHLSQAGIVTRHRQTCGDDTSEIAAALRLAFTRAQLVFVVGGLGPTEDDKTREGLSQALELELNHDPAIEREIRAIFEKRGFSWVESNVRQAMVPAGGVALSNPNGTAPGLLIERSDLRVIALPGPPRELIPILEHHILPKLTSWSDGIRSQSLTLRVIGIGESALEAKIGDLYGGEVQFGTYARPGEVAVRLHRSGPDDYSAELRAMAAQVRERLGDHIYAEGDTTLSAAILARLIELGATLATAESLTGGGVGESLTTEAGASAAYLGGVITYSSAQKSAQLGVEPEALSQFSPVSSVVAEQMARGVRRKFGATYGLSTTGVAGPGKDSDGNPPGKVFIGLSSADGELSAEYSMLGDRGLVRDRTVQTALTLLWNQLPR